MKPIFCALPQGWRNQSDNPKGQVLNFAWVKNPPPKFQGLWVVLENGKVIAASESRPLALLAAAELPKAGQRLVYKVPTLEELAAPEWW